MKCPLFAMATGMIEREPDVPINDCLKAECAWWAPAWETCAINVLAIRLTILQDTLEEIKKKIPARRSK